MLPLAVWRMERSARCWLRRKMAGEKKMKPRIGSNVKSLRELGFEFGMPSASKREIAMEVIRRAHRLGVMTSELMKRK